MSEQPKTAALATPLLQLPVVVAIAAVTYLVDFASGLAGLVALTIFWPPAVRWQPLAIGRVLAVYLPFAVCWFGFTIAYLQLMQAVGAPTPPQGPLEQLARDGLDAPGAVLLVFGIVVMAPVIEEVVFRGYLWSALDIVLPRVATHLVTAALFGLVHGLQYAVPIGLLALAFGWLRARHASLLAPILAHAVHNGVTVALVLLWPPVLDWMYRR
jgi:membrane protease YdiL (CAAX protease family)